ncbi:MAG: exostosin family protein [Patescibacteria group bacterium]|mgnify:CR=1 FL=1
MPEHKKITFFVLPAWRRKDFQHIPLLYPFWGNPLDKGRVPFQHALFERYGFDAEHYSITDNETKADLVLMPYAHNLALRAMPDLLAECRSVAGRLGKPLLIDGVGDIEHPVPGGVLVLRYGGYRFLRTQNEIIIPPYANDLLELYCGGNVRIRGWCEIPTVGFSGWALLTLAQEMRTLLKELPDRLLGVFIGRYRAKKKGVFFRRKALAILRRSQQVVLNVLIRASYSGHIDTASDSAETLRKEFVDNLLQSDYGLDIRGDANASTRLFEMLSLGRIPVIVDTERNFPFADKVDYRSFALIVDFSDLSTLGERIAAFHRSLAPEEFKAMQLRARDAYRNYFRVDALTRPLMEEIREKARL